MMYREQFEELKHTGELPSPSGVGMQILVLTQRKDCTLDEVVEVIKADPALTGRIIKLSSSSHFGGAVETATVSEAAMRLGLKMVSNVALSFTLIAGHRTGKCEEFDYENYWAWSLANANAAEILAREVGGGVPEEAFTCALLQRIGELALASIHPSDYSRVLRESRRPGAARLDRIERDFFRIDHHQVACALLADWGLPERYSSAALSLVPDVQHEELSDPLAIALVGILRVSSRLADLFVASEPGREQIWDRLGMLGEGLGISSERMMDIGREVGSHRRDWGEALEVPTTQLSTTGDQEVGADQGNVKRTEYWARQSLGSGLRILAVDDDAVSLRLLQRHLESAGHKVATATNGREALAVALETNPQIVVTDWMMPEMDGLQLCRALRRFSSGRNMYVLLLTGRDAEDRIVEAFEAGVDDYIVKPFNPKLLLPRIRAGRRVIQLQQQVQREKQTQREQVGKLAVLNRRLQAAALTDPLTDLPNRRYAMKRLEVEWANSQRTSQPLSILMVDIDQFKTINDTYGHNSGDMVLRETARAMGRMLRLGDTCARIGGEEFVVISPNTDALGAGALAERIRAEVERNRIDIEGKEVCVTVSLGVATRVRDSDIDHVERLLKWADDAIYEAKEEGRNRWVTARTPGERRSA